MKTLYTNGCSWTYGDELQEPQNTAWPVVLSEQINYTLVNDAICASSNRRILRTTVEWVSNYLKYNYPEDLLVIIMWTSPYRDEVIWQEQKTHKQLIYGAYNPNETDEEYKEFVKYWFENLFTLEESESRSAQEMILLASFLKVTGIKYVFSTAFGNGNTNDIDYIESNFNENKKWIEPIINDKTFIKASMATVMWQHNIYFDRGPRGHPLENSHTVYGIHLSEYLNDNGFL